MKNLTKKVLLSSVEISKAFGADGEQNRVLDSVTADIYEGDFTVIMGPSGAGKSTLLYALSGMEAVTGGKLFYKDQEISAFSETQMAALRAKEFGFVFQQTCLVSNLTLFENVAVAGYLVKIQRPGEVQKRTERLLSQMNVGGARNRLPSQVSGGEAQRAAIARAVINEPGLLFADEPTGALNQSNAEEVLTLLSGLNANGQSILMVTHDLRAAARGSRILYLEDGKILEERNLTSFRSGETKEREAELSAWLSSFRW